MKCTPQVLALESGPACDTASLYSHLGHNLTLGPLSTPFSHPYTITYVLLISSHSFKFHLGPHPCSLSLLYVRNYGLFLFFQQLT